MSGKLPIETNFDGAMVRCNSESSTHARSKPDADRPVSRPAQFKGDWVVEGKVRRIMMTKR